MTSEELLRSEAGKWLSQAVKDLNAARLLAQAEPLRSAFHSQQAAEKACKALLAYRGVTRRTDDLGDLGSQCAELAPSLEPVLQDAAELTRYASALGRSEAPEPETSEAVQALNIAEELHRQIQALLPAVSAD